VAGHAHLLAVELGGGLAILVRQLESVARFQDLAVDLGYVGRRADGDVQVVPIIELEAGHLTVLAAEARIIAYLELRTTDVQAAVRFEAGAVLQLEVVRLIKFFDGVQVLDAALAVLVLLMNEDDAVLDLDALVGGFGLAVQDFSLGAGIAPAGQILAVE